MTSSPFSFVFEQAPASAAKPDFAGVPPRILRDLLTLVQANSMTAAVTAPGGISASAAFVVSFDNGARLFIKGSHPGDQSHGAANLRGECAAYQALPILRDIAPPWCGMVYDDRGDDNGWWLGAWQALDIMPARPDADAAFILLQSIASADVPQDGSIALATAHPYLSQFFNDTYKWRRLHDDVTRAQKFAACFTDADIAREWLLQSLPRLMTLQAAASHHPFRLGLMHGDLRCDNLLYAARDGAPPRWWVVDWANAAEGPLLYDRVMLAASLLAAGTLDVAAAARHARGDHDADGYHIMLATMSGYFADQIYRAVPASMPRLREVQKAMFWALAALLADAGLAPPLPPLQI